MKTECTLTDDELIERCNEWVHKLAKSGGRDWSLQVPVNFNRDPDMLFIELGKRLKKAKERTTTSGPYSTTDPGMNDPRYECSACGEHVNHCVCP